MSHHSERSTAYDRLVRALRNVDQLFTHVQMAWLMEFAHKVAWRAGYEAGYAARVAQENANYPAQAVFDAREIEALRMVQQARAEADADRTQRYAGGPVPVWGADRPDLSDLGPSAAHWHAGAGVPTRTVAGRLVWRDEV